MTAGAQKPLLRKSAAFLYDRLRHDVVHQLHLGDAPANAADNYAFMYREARQQQRGRAA